MWNVRSFAPAGCWRGNGTKIIPILAALRLGGSASQPKTILAGGRLAEFGTGREPRLQDSPFPFSMGRYSLKDRPGVRCFPGGYPRPEKPWKGL